MENNQTGSILLRRGPTEDRTSFTPLSGEIIYDSTTEQIFVGDAQTAGGKPAFGDKIQVDTQGNITGIYLLDESDRPEPQTGLLRYNAGNNTLEFSDGENWNLIGSSPFENETNILYVSPAGRDDSTFGDKRGRTPGTAFKSLNAACREAERIVKRASKGLGPYVKTITFNQSNNVSIIDSIADVAPYKKIKVTNGNTSLDAEKEIRSGFRLVGQTSGAKAIIEEYTPSSGPLDEIVVDVEEGEFVQGESLKFGAAIPSSPFSDSISSIPEITIFVATGIYYEDFPIKVPVNTSIKGDEFRRSIIRPRPGMSRSPYADIAFKRDNDKIGLSGTGRTFGRHYLIDRNNPVVDFVSNEGGYASEAETISKNRDSIVDSVIAYIDANHSKLSYNEALCRRDTGYIIDALVLDLEFGGNRETLHAGLSYYGKEPFLPQNQVSATADSIEQISNIISAVVDTPSVNTVVTDFVYNIAEIVRDNFNKPRNNEDLDVLLMNDATIIRNITVQRHGGFMEVLDPEGQIKTRSPYTQTATSFSRSQAPQVSFAGGMFVDGFCGNLDGDVVSTLSPRELVLENFEREPQWPTSFFINGSRFQINKIDTVGVADNQYRAVLSEDTPWQDTYYQNVNEGESLPAFPVSIEVLTAGNVSILSNDFTQINDLGYGLYCTNAARAEAVSVFTYYCHKAYLSEKGSEIRSLNGSCAYGDFALVASGSDPLEVPDVVNLTQDQVQTAEVITNQDFPNNEGDIQVFVTGYDYEPFNTSEIEIDHTGTLDSDGEVIEFVRYFVTGVSPTNTSGVVQLNLSSGESSEAAGLATDVPNGTPITIRQSQLLQVNAVRNVQPTRPSTALVFQDDTDTVYRVLEYDIANLPPETANLGLAQSYDYVKFNVADSAGSAAGSGQSGDTVVRLDTDLDEKEKARILTAITESSFYEFGYNGIVHEVIGYRDKSQTGEDYAEIDIQPALNQSLAGYTNKPIFRGGKKAGSSAEITVRISTLRATSHDMLDIGTGSFQDANYPKRIFGDPEKPARQENEVTEENKGRVFYATSDQDGNFRVGEFFKVDQGTGTVTFAASVALSNLDGIGFKRGVAISEFSTDDGMLDNASDTVPVESAVRSYVNRRLGINHNNNPITNLIGPGFIDRDGILPMQGSLNLNSNQIVELADPSSNQHAATKNYVDTRSFSVNTITANLDNNISIDTGDIPEGTNLYYTSSRVKSELTAESPIEYDSTQGSISWNGNTSDVPEGANLYFTTSRARDSVDALDNGGDGSFSYDSSTGTFSYTGPSAAEVRSHLSGAGVVEYDSSTGVINVDPITVNGQTGQVELETDNVPESQNAVNRYFSEQRARNSVSAVDAGGDGTFSYDSSTGEFTYVGPSPGESRAHFSAAGDLAYNQNTGVFSVTTFKTADARQSISVSDQGGDGSLTYNSSTGVITYTGPSASEVRSHFSAAGDISYDPNSGVFSFTERSDSQIRTLFSATGDLTYDSVTGQFTISVPEGYTSSDFDIDLQSKTTDDLEEGVSNLYYTDTRVRQSISAVGDIIYNQSTGEFSFTERSDSDIRSLFSASGDITYNASTGEFSFTERSDSDIRSLFSASGDITYNASTGEFSVDFDSDFSSKSTDDLSEGVTNRYFSNSLVDSYLSGGSGINYSAGNISHSNTSSQSSVNNSGNTVIQDISLDEFGHITDINSSTITIPTATINLSASTGLNGGGSFTTDQDTDDTISFSLESDLRDGITHIGFDTTDYIQFNNDSRIDFYVNNGNRARIESDGDFHADGDIIAFSNTISDVRLKDNVTKISSPIEKIKQIDGVTFTRKHSGEKSAGVIAQQLEKILPEAVKEKALPLITGSENDLYKTVQYDALHALLIESVKTLADKVQQLENKIGDKNEPS